MTHHQRLWARLLRLGACKAELASVVGSQLNVRTQCERARGGGGWRAALAVMHSQPRAPPSIPASQQPSSLTHAHLMAWLCRKSRLVTRRRTHLCTSSSHSLGLAVLGGAGRGALPLAALSRLSGEGRGSNRLAAGSSAIKSALAARARTRVRAGRRGAATWRMVGCVKGELRACWSRWWVGVSIVSVCCKNKAWDRSSVRIRERGSSNPREK